MDEREREREREKERENDDKASYDILAMFLVLFLCI